MALPEAVQRQIDEADRIEQAMTAPVPTEPVDTPPAEPQPATEVATPAEPAPQGVPEETWEKRYTALQGKYNAEVPTLIQQNREMQAQIQHLMAAMEKKQEEPQQTTQKKQLITDEDREAFGNDLIDLADRVAQERIGNLTEQRDELLARINQIEAKLGTVDQRVAVSAEERFFSGLAARVPDWETINVDPRLLQWLQEPDPVYGIPRKAALDNAFQNMDYERTAVIFNTFKQVAGLNEKPRQEQPKQQTLQSQVAPTTSRTAPPVTGQETKRIWTQPEIASFYAEARRGYLTNEEVAKTEREIELAVSEGRVR